MKGNEHWRKDNRAGRGKPGFRSYSFIQFHTLPLDSHVNTRESAEHVRHSVNVTPDTDVSYTHTHTHAHGLCIAYTYGIAVFVV